MNSEERMNSRVSSCFPVNSCCCNDYIHQQFTISQTLSGTLSSPVTIYSADPFVCNSSQGISTNLIYPYGTIIAENLSTVPVTFAVYKTTSEDAMIMVIPSCSEIALTVDSIRRVDIFPACSRVRTEFTFDIFYPSFF